MSAAVAPISKRELLAYQANVKGSIFRQIRELLSRRKEKGFTQKEYSERIGMAPAQLSRTLRGDYDLRLETLSDLARGLDCRIDVKLTPLDEISPWERARMPPLPIGNPADDQNKNALNEEVRKPFQNPEPTLHRLSDLNDVSRMGLR